MAQRTSHRSSSYRSQSKRKRNNPDLSELHYKNIQLLNGYVDGSGKIMGRKHNGLSAKKQRALQKAIKQARVLGLMPFTVAVQRKI